MLLEARRTQLGAIGLVVLAACFRGPNVPASASLSPDSPDAHARVQGPFAVVYAAPRGHVIDRKQPGVTVLFSRGVRSVEMGENDRIPSITIKTKAGAPVAGSWRWTGTRGLLFTPKDELPGGGDYVVTVPADVKALDGATLGKAYTLELETDGPSVHELRVLGPAGVTDMALPAAPGFRVEFDQSVDPQAVAAATTLRLYKGDGDKGEAVKLVASREIVKATKPGSPATPPPPVTTPGKKPAKPVPVPVVPDVPESYVVVLKPERPLPLDRQVELTIASLVGTGGPRPMAAPYTHQLRTHGPLRFVDFYCPRIEQKGHCRANGDVQVTLSNPVAPEELKAHARLGALPPRTPGKEKRSLDAGVQHWLGVAPKIGGTYKITLTAGMKDVYGEKLAKDATFDLAVESALAAPHPSLVAADPEPAEEETTSKKKPHAAAADLRPRRERLPYRLDLGLSGQILEANVGSSKKVPVGAVNIPSFSTVATNLTDAQAVAYTLAKGSTNDFVSRNGFASTWTNTHADTNTRAVSFIDLDAVLAPRKGRGPALLIVSPPGLAADDSFGRTESLVTVTDLGVTAKLSPFGGLVWVTQLSTGKPVANASVAIRSTKQGEMFTGTTDAQGMVLVQLEKFDPIAKEGGPARQDEGSDESPDARVRTDAAIVVRFGDDFTIARVGPSPVEGRLTADFQRLSKEGRWAGMLFADRGVFRPGEVAKVSGIVRVAEASGLRSVAGRELRIQLTDRNSEQIFDGRAKCDDFGTFALDLPIPKTAQLGEATIVLTALPGGASDTSESGVFKHTIRILAFKANEFKVAVEPDKASYVRGDTALFTTQGDYLYGAPMQNMAVTTTVTRQEVPFTPSNSDGFTVSDDLFTGDYADETKAAEEVDSRDGLLDGKGSFTREVSLAFDDQRRPERVAFDAEVTDLSRASVSSRSSVVVHPGEFYVGIRSPKDRFVAAGTALKTEVAAIEPTGTRRPGVKVKVELVERRWSSVAGEQLDGRPTRSNKPEDKVISSCDAATGSGVSGCDLRVPRAGYFIVRATASDPRGNSVRSSTSIYGTEDAPTTSTAWAADDRHGIKLEANKPKYEIGETAKIVLRNPFREGTALVTIERNGVLSRQVIPIKGSVPVVEVAIKPEFYPNAFVSVVALRGRVTAPPAAGADLGGPDYRYGWTELHVNEEAHRLTVAITEPKTEYTPGSVVETDVVVKDKAGKPVESALTFYVVDEGVLALTSYVTPDPLPAFVKRRKLNVFTFDNREGLAHILAMKAGERFRPAGYEFALARNPGDAYDKGDDGGDGAGGKRADFRTTAFFEAGKKTDKNGHAHFSFKVPDNLTTFRIMAVAAGADDRFGSGESKITTYRKLMARPALPRLVRVGDSFEASVIVSSKLDEKTKDRSNMNVAVKIVLPKDGPIQLAGSGSQTITMQHGGQQEVRFPVKAVKPGEATFGFDLRSGADSDQVEMKRKVELPVAIESKVVYGETAKEATIALGKLDGIRPDYGGLDVRVASSALVGLGFTVDQLMDYPYACTEQLTSRVIPLVSMADLAKASHAHLPDDVNGPIETAVETILKRQNSDGGFGFWEHEDSEPWLSAYTMLGLSGAAADRKRFVPKDVLERGKDYLTFALPGFTRRIAAPEKKPDGARDTPDAGTPYERAEHAEKDTADKRVDYATAALIADTLVTLGAPNPGALNVLYDARVGQRLFGQAALLHAMAKSDMSAAQVKAYAKEIEGRLRIGPNGVATDEGDSDRYDRFLESQTRSLAAVLRAFLAVDPKHPLAARIARSLLANRHDGGWRTTQEDGWALLALADYRRLQESSAGDIEVKTYLGGSELLDSKFPRSLFREEKISVGAATLKDRGPTLAFAVNGDGNAFFSAELRYATTTLPKVARDEGLFVTKYVRGVPATAVTAALPLLPQRTADSVVAGDLVIVDLLFETAEPRDRIVLDDPLPAGLEALDYEIDTTSQAHKDASTKSDDPSTKWLGTTFQSASSRREVKDDRVVTFFDHVEPGMYRVHYLARATTLGTFIVPSTRIEAMYEPEVYGRTAATVLTVRPK